MLDHLFLDTVGALRAALDQSLLERAGQDDHLVYDLLTGDLVWETTVSLPGDGDPPRVSADISLDWQTWSQSAWRSISMGEQVEEPPEIGIEVVFRVQRLATQAGAGHRPGRAARGKPRRSAATTWPVRRRLSRRPTRKRAPHPKSPSRCRTRAATGCRRRAAGDDARRRACSRGRSDRSPGGRDALQLRSGATRQVSAATEATLSSLGSWVASLWSAWPTSTSSTSRRSNQMVPKRESTERLRYALRTARRVARWTSDRPYRLPRNVLPEHYSLVLVPDLASHLRRRSAIDVQVAEPTAEIVLNATELDISEARLRPGRGQDRPGDGFLPRRRGAGVLVPARARSKPATGRCTCGFRASSTTCCAAFTAASSSGTSGEEAWIAATQFEATDARRAFPCWDEPDLKASFGITIVADESLTVLSNAREISSEPLGNGKRRVHFADTIKMSTYLVAIVIGPFELTSPSDVDGVPLRIVSVPGRGALTGLAGTPPRIRFHFLREYFAMPYPADKLDHVAIPDFASGAMENLGLVTYRETALLVSEESSQVERQRVVSVDRPRNSAHVVRRPRHHALVGGHLVERGVRDVHGAADY